MSAVTEVRGYLPLEEKILGVQSPRRWVGSRGGTENKENEYPLGEKREKEGGWRTQRGPPLSPPLPLQTLSFSGLPAHIWA